MCVRFSPLESAKVPNLRQSASSEGKIAGSGLFCCSLLEGLATQVLAEADVFAEAGLWTGLALAFGADRDGMVGGAAGLVGVVPAVAALAFDLLMRKVPEFLLDAGAGRAFVAMEAEELAAQQVDPGGGGGFTMIPLLHLDFGLDLRDRHS